MERKTIYSEQKHELNKPNREHLDEYVKYLYKEAEYYTKEFNEKGFEVIDILIEQENVFDYYDEYERQFMVFKLKRPETDKEMETRRKKSESAKKAAEKRKQKQIEAERERLFQLLKKHPDVLKKLKKKK